jgi:hypothetical protein
MSLERVLSSSYCYGVVISAQQIFPSEEFFATYTIRSNGDNKMRLLALLESNF